MVPRSGPVVRAVFVARRVRRPGDSRDWVERIFGRYRAEPADQHGAEPVRAPRCERMGPGAWMVFDRRDAGEDELFLHVGRESAIQSCPRGGAVSQGPRGSAGLFPGPAVTRPV